MKNSARRREKGGGGRKQRRHKGRRNKESDKEFKKGSSQDLSGGGAFEFRRGLKARGRVGGKEVQGLSIRCFGRMTIHE